MTKTAYILLLPQYRGALPNNRSLQPESSRIECSSLYNCLHCCEDGGTDTGDSKPKIHPNSLCPAMQRRISDPISIKRRRPWRECWLGRVRPGNFSKFGLYRQSYGVKLQVILHKNNIIGQSILGNWSGSHGEENRQVNWEAYCLKQVRTRKKQWHRSVRKYTVRWCNAERNFPKGINCVEHHFFCWGYLQYLI